jgi:hypothetical protein
MPDHFVEIESPTNSENSSLLDFKERSYKQIFFDNFTRSLIHFGIYQVFYIFFGVMLLVEWSEFSPYFIILFPMGDVIMLDTFIYIISKKVISNFSFIHIQITSLVFSMYIQGFIIFISCIYFWFHTDKMTEKKQITIFTISFLIKWIYPFFEFYYFANNIEFPLFNAYFKKVINELKERKKPILTVL